MPGVWIRLPLWSTPPASAGEAVFRRRVESATRRKHVAEVRYAVREHGCELRCSTGSLGACDWMWIVGDVDDGDGVIVESGLERDELLDACRQVRRNRRRGGDE